MRMNRSTPALTLVLRLLGAAVLAPLALACSSSPQPATPVASAAPAAKEAEPPKEKVADEWTKALLDKLLADVKPADPAPARKPDPPPPPPPPPPVAAPAAAASAADSFDEDMKRIGDAVSKWDNGTGLAVRFLKEAAGTRVSLIYVDPTPPALNKKLGLWVVQSQAKMNNKIVGHFLILLKDLKVGRFEGSPTKKDAVCASLIGTETWDGKNPEAAFSTEPGAWCEVVLRPARTPGDFEGSFRGKLVMNNHTGWQTIESGYVYIKR
jgi:hypothetical protein